MPKVLVAAAPLKPIVDAILQGITSSTVLTRQGQDAHTMMLSFSQARAIDDADIIVVPDRAMNPIIVQLANERAHPPVIIALTELAGAEALPYPKEQPWLRGSEDEPEKATESDKHDGDEKDGEPKAEDEKKKQSLKDPHVWLDPVRVADLAMPLAHAIADYSPSHRAELESNAQQLSRHLVDEVQPNVAAMLATRLPTNHMYARPYVPFVTGHSAYQYFLARFDVTDPGALQTVPEEIAGAARNLAVMKRAGQVTIGCIITEQETPVIERVAKSSGARIVKISPENLVDPESVPVQAWMKNDYDRLLYVIAKDFASCL